MCFFYLKKKYAPLVDLWQKGALIQHDAPFLCFENSSDHFDLPCQNKSMQFLMGSAIYLESESDREKSSDGWGYLFDSESLLLQTTESF